VESEVPTEHSFGLVHDSRPVRDARFGQLRKNAPRSVLPASVWGARNERQIAPSTHVPRKKSWICFAWQVGEFVHEIGKSSGSELRKGGAKNKRQLRYVI
jgi:hypothetical protein